MSKESKVTLGAITAEYEKVGKMLDSYLAGLPEQEAHGRNAGNQGVSEARKVLELMRRNAKIRAEGASAASIEAKLTAMHEMTSLDTQAEVFKAKRDAIRSKVGRALMAETKKVKDYVRYKAKSGDTEFVKILKEIKEVEIKTGPRKKSVSKDEK
jgi:hypothetical protein